MPKLPFDTLADFAPLSQIAGSDGHILVVNNALGVNTVRELIDYAKATEDPHAPLVPGDHCRFCPAGGAGICPALKDKANAVAAQVFAPGLPPVFA